MTVEETRRDAGEIESAEDLARYCGFANAEIIEEVAGHIRDRDALIAERARREALSPLLAALQELEWDCQGGDYRGYCHVCAEPKDKGHDPDGCGLQAIIALASADQPEGERSE